MVANLTVSGPEYREVPGVVVTEEQPYFSLAVQACGEARLQLRTNSTVDDHQVYEV